MKGKENLITSVASISFAQSRPGRNWVTAINKASASHLRSARNVQSQEGAAIHGTRTEKAPSCPPSRRTSKNALADHLEIDLPLAQLRLPRLQIFAYGDVCGKV